MGEFFELGMVSLDGRRNAHTKIDDGKADLAEIGIVLAATKDSSF